MRFNQSIWISVLLPTAVCTIPLAAVTGWMMGDLWYGLFVAGGSLVCGVVVTATISRQARDAESLLRRPELQESGHHRTGLFNGLVKQALKLLDESRRDAQLAGQAKTDLEARMTIRMKRMRQLDLALNALDHPVLITDSHDNITFLNSSARQFFKLDPNEERFDSVELGRVVPLSQLIQETRMRSAATDHRTIDFELASDDEPVAYRATSTNIDANDTLLGVVTIIQDIRDEQEAKSRHAEFVSSVSHELKTPMAGIKAYIEMLIDGDVEDPEEQLELFQFIDVQVDRLTRLVNNMLNLARIQSGVIKVQREDCELNGILEKAMNVVRPSAADKQIEVISELSELYLPAHVDKDLFGQAVINLLSNAVKYTPEGGEVRLRSRMEEGHAVVEVRDNGMGIPKDSLSKLFERFYRVPENNKAAAGTGLGLALVQYIVTELHNGSIAVDSVVDSGSCFTVTVPLGHQDQNRKKQELCVSTT